MIRFRKRRSKVPELNTTSTADISFMLLILFLVTTSMDSDKGLIKYLQPYKSQTESGITTKVKTRNLLKIHFTNKDKVYLNNKEVSFSNLKTQIEEFILNPHNKDYLPEMSIQNVKLIGKCNVSNKHTIQITSDSDADYNSYFIIQNEIAATYKSIRNKLAQKYFKKDYINCNEQQQKAIRTCIPQNIVEMENS